MQIGLDVYNAVLIIRSEKALAQFGGHRVALGGEISVAAGPYGGGKGVDKGMNLDTGPEVYAYMHSRGAYFGVEVVGTVFVSRADENATMYHWPGIKASDIVSEIHSRPELG
jgi:lipid-binding SYLF domain-containing protein